MSTSLLYHAFGIRGPFQYVNTTYSSGEVTFKIEHKKHIKCPHCKSRDIIKRGTKERIFRLPPIGLKACYVRISNQRVECKSCSKIAFIPLKFAPKNCRYTHSFKRFVLSLTPVMTIKAIANYLKTSWDLVKDIQKIYLKRHYHRPSLKAVTRIAIDEIYCGRKSGFMTVVVDLDSRSVIYTQKGKSGASLTAFWQRQKRTKTKIEAIATDMGMAYVSSVKQHYPDAVLVIDHFHVIKRYQERLTELRRDLQSSTEAGEKGILKGTRWLLLKSPEKLDTDKGEDVKLKEALALNEPLSIAYYLKEKLQYIWKQGSKKEASSWLDDWVDQAKGSGINMLKSFAKTVVKFKDEILAYYDLNKMSSGPIEGINNRIKALSRQAYGYRDWEFYELKIKASHETKYAFSG